jgi:hypothetical protein
LGCLHGIADQLARANAHSTCDRRPYLCLRAGLLLGSTQWQEYRGGVVLVGVLTHLQSTPRSSSG